VDHRKWKRSQALFNKLPELQSRLREIEAKLEALGKVNS
jgi:hypothetical protein